MYSIGVEQLDQTGHRQVPVDLLVRLKDSAPAGYFNDQLILVTNDDQNPRIPLHVAGKIVPQPQPAEGVSHCAKIKKQDGALDWTLPARVLSHGQRRSTGLARLALSRRRVWILDEPVTALDAAGAALLAHLVAHHLDGGGLAVAATHAPLGLPPDRVRALSLD